jgi:hypothetical protein
VRGGAQGGGGWSGGWPASAVVREVPSGVGAGRWSGRWLQGVFDVVAELEDEQWQQPDRTGQEQWPQEGQP